MTPAHWSRLRAAMVSALTGCGDIMLRHFGRAKIRYKGKANLVTQVDHACEEHILRLIRSRFPDHDYLTEERAPKHSGSEFLWVVDPLDGTTNYAHGYPVACVSIGLLQGSAHEPISVYEPILGGIYDPFRDELFLAEKGAGAFLNKRRIRVSDVNSLGRSLLLTGFPYDRMERSDFYTRFYARFMELSHDVRRCGSAALDLAYVAAGRGEGFWEFQLQPWDVSAGWLLVREAGGAVSDFSGKPWKDLERFGWETLATNGRVHRQMLAVLERASSHAGRLHGARR